MQLKRLEIHGFKSFGSKCAIDFPPGVSSIVGPNGCGKSNIIDAIKWVMGEQSVKQLRGKSMGDVIFAGTDKRPAQNMAEVSLTLANNGADLPESVGQYTELMITRRLYRSGESAYLLNKQPCRLKDIQDIFLRYGMGSRSCAIIQQGNIGAITDATAEERRSFIEEAAGVVRYKTRKQEALSKVNATRQNLTRLNDIVEEIEKQLNSLSRQARKAERYKQYREELKRADTLISVYYHEDYASRIEKLEQLLGELQETDTYKSSELEKLNAALNEMDALRRKKDREIADKRAERSEKQRNIDKFESELKLLTSQTAHLDEEISRLDSLLAELHEKNRQIDSEITEEVQKTESLTANIQDVQNDLDREKQITEDFQTELSALSGSMEKLNKRLMELSSQRARYQNIYQNAATNKENLERRIKQIENDRIETEDKVNTFSEAEAEFLQKLESLTTRLDAIDRQKSECDESLKTQNIELRELTKSVSDLEHSRSKIKSRLNILKKMEANFEWYKDGVQAIMKKRTAEGEENGRDDRIIGITAEIIDPEPGFALAVEAVLGEALQYILVTDSRAGTDCISYLRDQNAGRCGFIPVEDCKWQQSSPESDTDFLWKHVSARPDLEPVISGLLSGVAVVDTLESGILLWKTEGHLFRKIATLDGNVISGNGIIVGGSKEKLAGILEKKQEIRQLSTDLEEIDTSIADEKTKQQAVENEVKSLENRLSALMEKKYRYESEQRDTEKERYQTAEQLKHARRQLEIITLEHRRLLGEKEDINSEIAQHHSALEEISGDIESVEAEIEQHRLEKERISETIKTYENQQLDLKLDLTRLTSELENNRRTVSRLKQFQKEQYDQTEQTTHDLVAKRKQVENGTEQIQEYESRLAAESESLRALKSQLRSEENDYQSVIGDLKKTDKNISQAKTELEQTRENIHKLELELSGLQINRENTINRFLERYSDSFNSVRNMYRQTVTAPEFSIEQVEDQRLSLRKKIEQIGEVNLGAITAYEEQKSRYDFLHQHRQDLEKALEDLENVIRKINRITRKLFTETFDAINEKFRDLFSKLFNGGTAWLELTAPDAPLETGVELMIQPPGKKLSRLSLLSGGEKALSAIAFIFSIFLLNPASFCLLDEIDAPLDDVNVQRFNELLRIIGAKSQIIMISHNKKTMEFSDMLFGITVAQSGGSQMISVNIEQAMEMNEPSDPQNSEGTETCSTISLN